MRGAALGLLVPAGEMWGSIAAVRMKADIDDDDTVKALWRRPKWRLCRAGVALSPREMRGLWLKARRVNGMSRVNGVNKREYNDENRGMSVAEALSRLKSS